VVPWISVALGSAIGGVLRYGVGRWLEADWRPVGGGLPWGTLTVNVVGSLAIGLLAGWLSRSEVNSALAEPKRLFWIVGVCGGFTTFSAFSMQIVGLLQAGQMRLAFTYAAVSFVTCLAACFLGQLLVR
jgi:CrcB protein